MTVSSMSACHQHHRQLGRILAAPVLGDDTNPIVRLRAARKVRDTAEVLLTAAVREAREAGRTWQDVGDGLGISRQAAFQKYGKS